MQKLKSYYCQICSRVLDEDETYCEISDCPHRVPIDELKQIAAREGYFCLTEIPGHGLCGLYRLLYTIALCCRIGTHRYDGRYCYKDLTEAKTAISEWDGIDDPPGNWMKYKGSNAEYSNPNYKL